MQIDWSKNKLQVEGGKAIVEAIAISPSLTSISLSSNELKGVTTESDYVKGSKVEGSSFNVGDKVVFHFQGKEMVVSQGKDSDGDIVMKTLPDLAALSMQSLTPCASAPP